MKSTMKQLLSFILICLCLPACKDYGEVALEFSIDKTAVTLSCGIAGSTDILMMAAPDNVSAYVSEEAESWLTVTTSRRCLTLSYTKNDSGIERTGTVTVHAGTETVTIAVTMPPYFESNPPYAVGDIYCENGKKVGVIFWVDASDSTIAKAVSLERRKAPWWSSEGSSFLGAYSLADGQSNTKIIRNSDNSKNGNIPALTFCDELGEGWYWPAISELNQLFVAYNGVLEEKEATKEDELTEEELASRHRFDKIFTDNGGEAISDNVSKKTGDSYWASTEDNSGSYKYGCNVRFYIYGQNMGAGQCKKTGSRFIRCIKALGDYVPEAEPIVVTFSLDKTSVELESSKGSQQTITATVKNGTLLSATLPTDVDWCSAEISGGGIVLEALSDNSGNENRQTEVVVTVKGEDDKDYSKTVTVIQKKETVVSADSFKVGEYYESGTDKGVVFWVSDDGQTAKIVSLERSENTMAWSTEQKSYNVTDKDNGVANTSTLMKIGEKEVPAIAFCKNGWYWPAINELKALFEAYNSTTFDQASIEIPDKITDAEKTAREAFEKTLTDHGGTKLNTAATTDNGDQYWGSTELSNTVGSCLRFGKKNEGTDAKKTKTDKRYVRCIKQIGKNAQSPQM